MPESAELRGLWEGFEIYGSPGDSDLENVLRDGIVVIDTNVLLYLYRCGSTAREQIFDVLDKVSDSLFMPAQVQTEFWRNRDDVIRRVVTTNSLSGLREVRNKALSEIRSWRRRTMSTSDADDLSQEVDALFKKIINKVGADDSGKGINLKVALRSIEDDPIAKRLRQLFEGRVGLPYASDVFHNMVKTGRERFARDVPPGYMDREKVGQEEEGVGDYLLWEQTIDRAELTKKPVLLVTDDEKEDWWRLDADRVPIGPRVELIEEMERRTGVRLFMLTRPEFLASATELLGVPVDESTIEDTPEDVSDADETVVSTLWTPDALEALLNRLADVGATEQEAVLRYAAQTEKGFAPREKVYKITGRPSSRTLVGFRKPVVSAMRYLQGVGDLPDGLEVALRAEYKKPGKTDGYRVPPSIVEAAKGSAGEPI